MSAKKAKKSQTQKQVLRKEQVSVSKEAEYIIRRAQEMDARVVRLGALILFSTLLRPPSILALNGLPITVLREKSL